MYLLFMIMARIRWCTCRVENILTLGKLVSLWFVSSSILFVFDISNLLSYIQISSYELARPIMGTIFLVDINNAGVTGRILPPNTDFEHARVWPT